MLCLSLVRAGAWREASNVIHDAFCAHPLWPAALVNVLMLHMRGRIGA